MLMAAEIDIDALLAVTGTTLEPSADCLLRRQAIGDGETPLWEIPRADFKPWRRYMKWWSAPGRWVVCAECATACRREYRNDQLCANCRVSYQRTCVDCGGAFSAPHHAFKRCPPCRQNQPGPKLKGGA